MPETINFSLLAGFILSVALIASALLGWLGDIKRVGAATSARETTRRAKRNGPRPASSASGARGAGPQKRSASAEQEARIRDAYFAKERKAREFRERQRRQQARQRARASSGGTSGASGGSTHAPPPSASTQEATYRLTLQLTGPATKESVRIAYRRLIAAYHPDRCATLGVKLQKLAEEETKRINEAYSYFRRVLK